ncbi:MAG: NUDIX hydrolase [Acidobacteriales bacterium]|nr:NUDIX hydrolase [Terriglobales bacterium]
MRREYPDLPVVGVGAIVLRSSPEPQVVLVKRRNPPLAGEWTIPGGMLELGESLEAGAVREAREETGLDVQSTGAVEVFDRIYRDEQSRVLYHYVLVDYICSVTSGALHAGSDAEEARWFADKDLSTPGVSQFTASIVRKAFARFQPRADPCQ